MIYTGGNDLDITAGVKIPLKGNGDFRDLECLNLIAGSDIIVTNPPFSLFRDFVMCLMEYKKKFVIIGNQNAIIYREILPLFKTNSIRFGIHSGDMAFKVPDDSEPRKTRFWVDDTGQKFRSLGNVCWFTNLDHNYKSDGVVLTKTYDPELYPRYDNYNAIEVSKVKDIPKDYDGVMGVPITFLQKFNPDQFEVLGFTTSADHSEAVEALRLDPKHRHGGYINGKEIYRRVLIRRRG